MPLLEVMKLSLPRSSAETEEYELARAIGVFLKRVSQDEYTRFALKNCWSEMGRAAEGLDKVEEEEEETTAVDTVG